MALPACQPSDLPPLTDTFPELNDADYFNEVLRLAADKHEHAVDEELTARAATLGITPTSPLRHPSSGNQNTSRAESASTALTSHARTLSSASHGSASTTMTSHSSIVIAPSLESQNTANPKRRSRGLSFSYYDKYLQQVDPNINQPKFLKEPAPEQVDNSGQSLFSVTTRKSYISIKKGLKRIRWRKTAPPSFDVTVSCICCRDDFDRSSALQALPCGHTYCRECLRIMITQSTTDESKMPPRCCILPIPSSIVKSLLTREEQHLFLKSVLQFNTPWEARIFCPNASCGEFIPPRHKIDPKHPFDVVCKKCRTKVCVMCKRDAHQLGQDCPYDWELDAVLKMGERSGWRRCYKCRTLVELAQGCTHMTCRCKAQFCYICGAVWDPSVGCPNFCNGEEEMERRRVEEEARAAELEAEKAAQEAAAAEEAAELAEAEKRTSASPDFAQLRQSQEEELARFRTFMRKTRWIMWSRQAERKLAVVEKYSDQIEKMKERHAKSTSHLEDRQIAAEMELRGTLNQSEKSVRIRLKHMEAYCDGLGCHPDSNMPTRTVTERDLRELGQQYNLRDGMDRLHAARINVMRDRQAKRMEELVERQELELDKLAMRREEEVENLAAEFAHEEDVLAKVFGERRERIMKRWETAIEVLRRELEVRDGVRYAGIETPAWREQEVDAEKDGLPAVAEEGR